MGKLFDNRYVYPSDREGGRYVDLSGTIVSEDGAISENEIKFTVRTPEGDFCGWTSHISSFRPQVGYFAKIRVYDAGGGWYPDNRITGWSSVPW